MLDKKVIQLEDSSYILIEVLNARQFRISTNSALVRYHDEYGYLDKLSMLGGITVTLGKDMEIEINKNKHKYNVHSIRELSNSSYLITTEEATKTRHFILPTLRFNKEYFQTDTFLVNAYLSSDLTRIFLKYRFVNSDLYFNLEKFLNTHDNFVTMKDMGQFVQFELTIPEEYHDDVQKFMQGKYSELSDRLKHNIMKFYGFKRGGDTYNVLYKQSIRRRQLELDLGSDIDSKSELYSIPIYEQEVIVN